MIKGFWWRFWLLVALAVISIVVTQYVLLRYKGML